MYRSDDDQLIQLKYTKVKENIDALFTKMSGFSSCTNVEASNFKSWEELKENLTTLQAVLTTLQETKEQLLQVNTQVHRFASDCGNYEHKFKDDVITLYQQYDDIYEQNGKQLTDLQDLDNRWRAYDQRIQSLRSKIKDSEFFACSEDCDNNSPTAEDEEFEILKTRVKELRTDAGYFESQLKDGPLWKLIDEDLRDLEKQIDKRTKSINASRTVHHPISSVAVEDDPDDRFEDAIQHQREDSDVTDFAASANEKKADISKAKKGSSRFWRVIRMAVPVQLALVLLYCLACYLEPNCCDMVNNFNFSFTPQLRYFNGMPPV